jgi:hypothetical protein
MPSRSLINFVVAIVALAYLVSYVVQGAPVTSDLARPLGAAAAVAALLLQAFDRWVWRWPLIFRFVRRPHIGGTWRGTLESHWIDPETNQRIPPDDEVYMVIRQTYWTVSARLITRESKSYSMLATIDSEGNAQYSLMAIYRNTPRARVRHRSQIHHGSLMLDIAGDPPSRLEGFYWTDRQTMGEIELTRRFGKHVNDFANAHALSEPRA